MPGKSASGIFASDRALDIVAIAGVAGVSKAGVGSKTAGDIVATDD